MKPRQSLLWVLSLTALIAAYAFGARAVSRPDILPPMQDIAGAFAALVGHGYAASAGEEHRHHHHSSDQVDTLLQEGVTLQASLAVSTARVLFGLAIGVPLGVLLGLLMGWSRRADDYLHPIYVLLRSVPPLALITYVMLWLGHSEAHRLIPIVYAVAVTAVIRRITACATSPASTWWLRDRWARGGGCCSPRSCSRAPRRPCSAGSGTRWPSPG